VAGQVRFKTTEGLVLGVLNFGHHQDATVQWTEAGHAFTQAAPTAHAA
jgi:hypothetical protein